MPSTPQGLTRITINLTRAAAQSLDYLCEHTGYNRTDCINRAANLHRLVQEKVEQGGQLAVVRVDGTVEPIYLI